MQDFLFDPPLVWPAVAFVVGLCVFFFGNARTKAPIRNAGAALAALVVAWCVTAYYVRTPLEKSVTRSRAIVASVEKKDWPGLRGLLDRDTRMMALGSGEAIAAAAERAGESFGVTNIRVISQSAARGSPTAADVTLVMLVEGSMTTRATFTFQYDIDRDGGIRLKRIVPVEIGGSSGEDLRGRIGN